VTAGQPADPKLKAETQAAFDRYVRLAEARQEAELKDGTKFCRPTGSRGTAHRGHTPPEARRNQDAEARNSRQRQANSMSGRMIHHWTGVVFLAGSETRDRAAVLEDYDHHAVYYAPDVERSRIESRQGDHFRASCVSGGTK